MSKRLAFMGAGAVGSYIGGHLARAGQDVTLIDPWPDHIDTIKRDGLHLEGTQGEYLVRGDTTLQIVLLYGAVSFGAFSLFWTGLTFLLSGPPFRYPAIPAAESKKTAWTSRLHSALPTPPCPHGSPVARRSA